MDESIPSQGEFFYKGNWTREVDAIMLNTIVKAKRAFNWEGTVIPIPFLMQASEVIAAESGLQFTVVELYERFQLFEHRYRAFKEVNRAHGFHWNVNSNEVIGPEPVWKELLEKDKLTAAYYYFGEPEFNNLEILFATSEIKKENSETVIILSDTTIPLDDHIDIGLPKGRAETVEGEASDSVNSPILAPGAKLRRKLFDEDGENEDDECQDDPPSHYYVQGSDGKMRPKMAKPRLPTRKNLGSGPSASPHGSSVGSTSPNIWRRNHFK